MAYHVRLKKLSKNENALRTEEIEGFCESLPEMKRSFQMKAPSIDPEMDVRKVYTSDVQSYSIMSGSIIDFWTLNSKYRLEILAADVENPFVDQVLFISIDSNSMI